MEFECQVTDVQRLSLEVMTLNPMCEGVETAQGVPLTVTGVAQCKIMKVWSYSNYLFRCNDENIPQYFISSDSFNRGTGIATIKMLEFHTFLFSLRLSLNWFPHNNIVVSFELTTSTRMMTFRILLSQFGSLNSRIRNFLE